MDSSLFIFNLIIIITSSMLIVGSWAESVAKAGCSDTCDGSSVRILYPFGIGPKCAINQSSYVVSCVASKPYLTNLNLEVLSVSLQNLTVTLNFPMSYSCSSTAGKAVDLTETPFFYLPVHNKMMLFGCGNAVLTAGSTILTGCTSTCELNTSSSTVLCHGVGCCEATVPFYLTRYGVEFRLSRISNERCSLAFLADQDWVVPQNMNTETSVNVPVILAWTLSAEEARAMYLCSLRMRDIETESGQRVRSYMCPICEIDPESTNPYLHHQCGAGGSRRHCCSVQTS